MTFLFRSFDVSSVPARAQSDVAMVAASNTEQVLKAGMREWCKRKGISGVFCETDESI